MRRFRSAILLILAVGIGLLARAPSAPIQAWHVRRLEQLVPELDPEVARRVVDRDDAKWLTFARSIGVRGLADAYQAVIVRRNTSPPRELLATSTELGPIAFRIADAFARLYDFRAPLEVEKQLLSFDESRRLELMSLMSQQFHLIMDQRLPPLERRRRLEQVVAGMEALGAWRSALHSEHALASVDADLGEPERHRAHLESILARARVLGEPYVEAQLLGELGSIHAAAGEDDSVRLCYDEALAIARRHSFLDQAARILRFDAGFHADRGRLALAADRLTEMLQLCDLPEARSARVRMQIDYAAFLVRTGCWDLAARVLRRLPPLFRQYPSERSRRDTESHRFVADRLLARLEFEDGDAEAGDRQMRELATRVPSGRPRAWRYDLFLDWTAGLVSVERWTRALELCEHAIVYADTTHAPGQVFRYRRALALERLGRFDELDGALVQLRADLARDSLATDALARDVELLEVSECYHRGRTAEARARLGDCQRRFERRLAGRQNGMQNYLEVDEARALRAAWHRYGGLDAAAGYRLECRWRSLSQLLRGGGDTRLPPLESDLAGGAPPVLGDGVHLVYHVEGDRTLRWTATRSGVRLDTLALSSRACLERVRHALSALQTETPPPGALLGPAARAALEPLARLLLPAPIAREGASGRAVFVSADGPLLALPFEALPLLATPGQPPLAALDDVAYVHGWRASPLRIGGRPVIVANPEIPGDLRRRYAAAGPLEAVPAEVAAAKSRWPEARVLEGRAATKENLFATWPSASVIYLASHHVRDPDAPFLGFVPLAVPEGGASSDALLEIADVHGLDLSACRLVVLASCASGAPYRLARRPGPSLGEAFLDSGAGAVIESLWEVRDAEAGEFMRRFLAAGGGIREDLSALQSARRQMMTREQGCAPSVWAAWSVHVRLPRTNSEFARAPHSGVFAIAPRTR